MLANNSIIDNTYPQNTLEVPVYTLSEPAVETTNLQTSSPFFMDQIPFQALREEEDSSLILNNTARQEPELLNNVFLVDHPLAQVPLSQRSVVQAVPDLGTRVVPTQPSETSLFTADLMNTTQMLYNSYFGNSNLTIDAQRNNFLKDFNEFLTYKQQKLKNPILDPVMTSPAIQPMVTKTPVDDQPESNHPGKGKGKGLAKIKENGSSGKAMGHNK